SSRIRRYTGKRATVASGILRPRLVVAIEMHPKPTCIGSQSHPSHSERSALTAPDAQHRRGRPRRDPATRTGPVAYALSIRRSESRALRAAPDAQHQRGRPRRDPATRTGPVAYALSIRRSESRALRAAPDAQHQRGRPRRDPATRTGPVAYA